MHRHWESGLLGYGLALLVCAAGPAWGLSFSVNDLADGADDNVGDGICHTAAGTCTLRAAIQEANASPAVDVITIPGNNSFPYTLSITGADEDNAATGDLDIVGAVTITTSV